MRNEKGIVHIAILIILIAGLAAGLYLSQHPQIFKPRANVSNPRAEFVDANGNLITQTADTNVRLRIIRQSVTTAGDVALPTSTPSAPTPIPRLILQNRLPGGRTVPLYQLIEPPATPTRPPPELGTDFTGEEPGVEAEIRGIRDAVARNDIEDWYQLQWELNNKNYRSRAGNDYANALQYWIYENKTGKQVGAGPYPGGE